MGCASSVQTTRLDTRPAPTPSEKSHRKWSFSFQSKYMLAQTWRLVSQDIPGSGLQLFLRIFERCPEVKKLFFVDGQSLDEIKANTVIKTHGARFMQAIGGAVENLGDIDNKLSPLLFNLGCEHKKLMGFDPDYFTVFYEVLLDHWKNALGVAFTTDVEDAWKYLFAFIIEKLKQGYFSQ